MPSERQLSSGFHLETGHSAFGQERPVRFAPIPVATAGIPTARKPTLQN
jgi:hypothetical protein